MASPLKSVVSKGNDGHRLLTDVVPEHYDITIKTDLENLNFSGFAAVDLTVEKTASSITFNAAPNLKLQKARLRSTAFKEDLVETHQTSDAKAERVTIHFNTEFKAGSKVQLLIGWESELKEAMLGYYHSSFEHEGRKRYYALTQFEPTAARRAFPCWDEPLLKAEYTISLITRGEPNTDPNGNDLAKGTASLSNMPAVSEKVFPPAESESYEEYMRVWYLATLPAKESAKDKWKITKFERSPRMSTYLVAFANGHFEHKEDFHESLPTSENDLVPAKKVRLRIYATPDIISQTKFALDVKKKVLPWYEKLFKLRYPLPKLDTLVAHDFDAGAMENWGLITGRTSAFLYDEKKSDLAGMKRVATVQSHECAHMWFGDIVTMKWWDNLWLNEGFATIMGEVIIIDKIFPEWKVQSEFITNALARALELDAQRSSHPIEVEVPDANQINQIFDALSYSKAGSILRMLANFVGEEAFLNGVSKYLTDNAYGNTVTTDLWKGISHITKPLEIEPIMENWILKIGFPVITVKEIDGGIHVRQDRFLSTGDASDAENQTIWFTPLFVLSTDAQGKAVIDRRAVLDKRETELKLDTSKPFKLNAGTVGVYRVAYSPERLAKLGEQAAHRPSPFTLEDKMGLVNDALVLAKSGYSKTSGALNLIEKLQSEEEYLVWDSISTQLAAINKVIWEQPQSLRDSFNAFRRILFSPLVKKLGYEFPPNESPDIRQLRTLAITNAANGLDESVVEELKARFKHFQDNNGDDSRIPADLQRIVYATAVRHGGKKEWETVRGIFEKPPTPTAKIAAMLAMTSSEDPAVTEDTLNFLLNSVPLQDWMYYFAGLGGNRTTRRRLVRFYQEEYDVIMKKFEGIFLSLGYFVKYAFDGLSSERDALEVEAFFKTVDTGKYSMSVAQALDSIRASAAWLERDKTDLEEWFEGWEKRAKL